MSERVPPPFHLSELPAPAGVLLVRLEGELDLATAARVHDHLEARASADVRDIVLDLEEVPFIDSSMLKELLRARALVAARGGQVVLAAAQEPVRRLLELTATGELFALVPSVGEGLARVDGAEGR